MGRIDRHELGEPVDLSERHFEHAADVAHHSAGEKRAEGDDLRHPVGAVAAAHIGDHLVAPVLAEVDVEVRHRHALGIEEALEQQAEAHRVEIGDGESPGDQRAGARAASRTDRDALRLGPFDEVGDDQEIAGKFHLDDDVELEGEAFVIVLPRKARREPVMSETVLEPLARLAAQLLFFVHDFAAGDGKARQNRLPGQGPVGAAHGDLDAGLGRLRQVGEKLHHFRARLEPVLGRETAAVGSGQDGALGHAEQRVMRLVVGAGGEIGLVGRDERQAGPVGEVDQRRFDRRLQFDAVALDLDVEAPVERLGEAAEPRLGDIGRLMAERTVDRPGGAAGQRDEPLAAEERVERKSRLLALFGSSQRPETSRIRWR